MTLEIVEYLDANETSQFARWFDELDPQAAAKVTVALQRIRQGNLSNAKGVGAGILEYRIDFGPGYRIAAIGRDRNRKGDPARLHQRDGRLRAACEKNRHSFEEPDAHAWAEGKSARQQLAHADQRAAAGFRASSRSGGCAIALPLGL